MSVREIGFSFGILFDDLETQANKQGYTLGEDAGMFENLRHCLNVVRINRLLTDVQADKAYGRLIKQFQEEQRGAASIVLRVRAFLHLSSIY